MTRQVRKKRKLVRSASGGSGFYSSCVAIEKSSWGGNDVDGLYELLGVSPHASFDEIDNACMDAMRKWHPDAGGSHDMFCRVSHARDVLTDPLERRVYDNRRSESVRMTEKKDSEIVKKRQFSPCFFKESFIILSMETVGEWQEIVLNAYRDHRISTEVKIGFRQGTAIEMEGDVLSIGTGIEPSTEISTLLALTYLIGERK